MNHDISSMRFALIALPAMLAVLLLAALAPFSARAQTSTPQLDFSNIPISQIGTPIALFIKCVLLQQVGPPIPTFPPECANVLPPPGGGHQAAGGLTGQVISTTSTSSGSGGGGGSAPTSTGALSGEVVQTQVGGQSAGGGGGGGGGGSSGGGGGGGGSPGQVLGAATTPGGVGGFSPEMPSTGEGGSAPYTLMMLLSTVFVATIGALYLARPSHA